VRQRERVLPGGHARVLEVAIDGAGQGGVGPVEPGEEQRAMPHHRERAGSDEGGHGHRDRAGCDPLGYHTPARLDRQSGSRAHADHQERLGQEGGVGKSHVVVAELQEAVCLVVREAAGAVRGRHRRGEGGDGIRLLAHGRQVVPGEPVVEGVAGAARGEGDVAQRDDEERDQPGLAGAVAHEPAGLCGPSGRHESEIFGWGAHVVLGSARLDEDGSRVGKERATRAEPNFSRAGSLPPTRYALREPCLERPMSRARSPHLLRRPRSRFWTVAILLTAGSMACDDDPVTPLPRPSTMEIVAGDGQAGRVGESVPDSLVVRVLDDDSGTPVSGVVVVWTAQGGGSVLPESVPTDADGLAAAHRVLGPTAGDQTTTAAVSDLPAIPPVTFTTTAVAED
jgi:hypothetical protein